MLKTGLCALGLLASGGPLLAETVCKNTVYDQTPYTLCEVTSDQDLRLFHSAPDGSVLGSFSKVDDQLQAEGKTLRFAMNAGMYHPDRAPVGLLITEGKIRSRIATREGPGNFGLLPNGVFCISGDGFSIMETKAYVAADPDCRFATQSGPMLVINGELHPRFIPDSDSRYVRNGIGVSGDGTRAVLAISGQPVNFADFGSLFRDELKLPNALYFDGKISRLYSPELRRNDFGFQMGPIIGLAEPR